MYIHKVNKRQRSSLWKNSNSLFERVQWKTEAKFFHPTIQKRRAHCLKFAKYKDLKSSEQTPCPTLCDPMDCSPPGSSAHGIFLARILEWVAISFSRRSSRPRDWTRSPHCRQTLYRLSHQGSRTYTHTQNSNCCYLAWSDDLSIIYTHINALGFIPLVYIKSIHQVSQ